MTSEMQIIVDDQSLDNGSWRKIYGQITNISSDGVVKITATFKITGRTPEEANDRWQETKLLFTKQNPHVLIYGDGRASRPTEDISWSDGLHQSTDTRVSWDSSAVQTGRVFDCVFVCTATEFNTNGTPSGAGAQKFAGQQGSIKLVKTYSTGNVHTRAVEATFGPTFDKTKYGPFSLNTSTPPSIVNGIGDFVGKARILLVGSLPAFKNGQKATIAGTTNYNGIFEILDITGQYVTISKAYGSNESPMSATLVIGEGNTGEENFNAAKSSLLTDYLTTLADGGPDPTTKQSLRSFTLRNIDLEGSFVLATLNSGEFVVPLTGVDSARIFDVTVGINPPDNYNEDGGAAPIMYSGKGSIVIDQTALGSTNLSSIFGSAEGSIKTEIGKQSNIAPTALRLVSKGLAISADGMFVNFEVTYTSVSVSALKYNVTVTEDESTLAFAHRDFDGYHLPQTVAGPNEKTILKTVTRLGYGKLNLGFALAPPVESGFTYQLLKRTKIYQGKQVSASGEDIYEEAWSALYIRWRVRRTLGGGGGGGASGSGGKFKDGYFTPTGPDV